MTSLFITLFNFIYNSYSNNGRKTTARKEIRSLAQIASSVNTHNRGSFFNFATTWR